MTTQLYRPPKKAILSQEQLESFKASKTHADLVAYITTLNECVVGVKLRDDCPQSDVIGAIMHVLDQVDGLAKATPPVENSASRFGNPAFRTFYDKVSEMSPAFHESIPGLPREAIPEVSVYFAECWGNRTRIDYGSGMELNFLCWLMCLESLGVIGEGDHKALVIRVFWSYIRVMRVLQSTYWLEPAGSHGVWGLDDYHFLPFLFGAAQLKGHRYIRPKSIHDKELVDEYSKDYMYLACIQFINSIKTASLRWHSPMLDDISGVKTWDKVNSGMIKMYQAEVLGKLPVIQHFYFGSILPYQGIPAPAPQTEEDDVHWGHSYGNGTVDRGWGDCCGIPVPSAFGAVAEEQRKIAGGQSLLRGAGIKPVPFD
ncbi:Serine/threonine-protein phosphatase 2A activator 2 [Tulasnella sp. JGI-2019a]|nr:Serine/threonine-protein phosphatase 2A activator 2 [Tulasnella sp. JGI-2019a]